MKRILSLCAVLSVLAACSKTAKEVHVTGVSLNQRTLALYIGDKADLVATVTPEDADDPSVSWKSSDVEVATVSDGHVTGVSVGTAVITVTTKDGGKTATCAVSVTKKPVPVVGISLNKTSTVLTEGDTEQLTATIDPENADNPNYSWSTSNANVVTVVDGLLTAIAKGNATITVTTEEGAKTATCTVTVNEKVYAVTGVSLDQSSATIKEGANVTLTATITPANATNKNVSWTSSNEAVATVANGVVTGVSVGTAVITVTTEDGGMTASCTVTVESATIAVTGVSLNKTSIDLSLGQNFTLVATIAPVDATNKAVSWESSNTDVATVENGVVTAVAEGTAIITVTTADGGKTATCTVNVKDGSFGGTFTNEGYTEGEPFTWN